LEKILLTVGEWCGETWAKNRIRGGKSSRAVGVTRPKVIKLEELAVERNRREGNIPGLTIKNLARANWPISSRLRSFKKYCFALVG
jgi:hypothetical protein